MVEDETGHDGDCHSAWTVSEHLGHLLVLQTNHVLAVDLCDVMVGQNTIPTGKRSHDSHLVIHDDWCHIAIKCKSHDNHMTTHSPGSRGVLHDGLDLPTVVAEPNVVTAILLHGDGTLKGTVTHSKRDLFSWGFLDELGSLV